MKFAATLLMAAKTAYALDLASEIIYRSDARADGTARDYTADPLDYPFFFPYPYGQP